MSKTRTATTEKQWLAAKEPLVLWYSRFARDHRKRRLAACAFARRVLPLLPDAPPAVALVEAVERFADRPKKGAAAAWKAVLAARRQVGVLFREYHFGELPQVAALHAINGVAHPDAARAAAMFWWAQRARHGRPLTPGVTEAVAQAAILREVFGNPFRDVTFEKKWRTSTAVALAKQMYESRDFGAMPILADALQDAGCEEAAILAHCRNAKATHVRGCWVVDLVLGKG